MSAVAKRSGRVSIRITLPFPSLLRAMAQGLARVRSRARPTEGRTEPTNEKCIFCQRDDATLNRLFARNATFFARFDNFPANEGHLEIVPNRHVETLFALTDQEVADAYALLREARNYLEDRYKPDGYTIGINEGPASGQSIPHLHIHLIPRHHGDVPDPRGGIRQAAPNWDPDGWVVGPEPT